MAGELMTGLSIFNTMMNMAKALKDIDNAVSRNAAVIELQDQIFSAQSAQTTLIARVGDLEEEVRSFEAWETEKERYELHDLGGGRFVYRLKEGVEPPEPAHEICTSCYQERKKSILQRESWNPGRAEVLTCKRCGTTVYVHGVAYPDHQKYQHRTLAY